MKITAAVAAAPGEPLRLEDVTVDGVRPGELLVRLVATGVCHTDVMARAGRLPFPLPGVLGHEGVGRVVDVGDAVTGLRAGDPVLLGWPSCGGCRTCLAGRRRYCLRLPELLFSGRRPDGSVALRRQDGAPLCGHYFGQSSFASHALVSAGSVIPLRTSLPLPAVGTLACGFATGAGAVLYAARPEPGASLVVYGAGAVGLAAVMAARLSPATTIVAVDRDPARLALARRYGATETVDVSGVRNVARSVREACRGPADIAIDCTGDPRLIRQAVESVGVLGVCYLVGTSQPGERFCVDQMTTLRGKRIQGSLGGEASAEVLVPALLRLAEQGRFPFPELVEYVPFGDPEAAMLAAQHGEAVKPVLLIDSPGEPL